MQCVFGAKRAAIAVSVHTRITMSLFSGVLSFLFANLRVYWYLFIRDFLSVSCCFVFWKCWTKDRGRGFWCVSVNLEQSNTQGEVSSGSCGRTVAIGRTRHCCPAVRATHPDEREGDAVGQVEIMASLAHPVGVASLLGEHGLTGGCVYGNEMLLDRHHKIPNRAGLKHFHVRAHTQFTGSYVLPKLLRSTGASPPCHP